jgi:predicted ferric reductase
MSKKSFDMHIFWWILVSLFNILLLFNFYQTIDFNDSSTSIISVGNILIAILVRNELILHLLYRLAVWTSTKIVYGKYYFNSAVHYIGGVHASCATWGFLWLAIDVLQQLGNPVDPLSMATSGDSISIAISTILLTLLFIIIITAIPPLRDKFHDTFEISHRYLGWSCLGILILHQIRFQFIIALNQTYPLETLLTNPVLLMVALMTFSIFLPWISVERFDDFTMHCPSSGVLVITVPGSADVGTFARISLDGVEWHSFSVAKTGFNKQTAVAEIHLIIGAVGDWTKNLIRQVEKGNLPKKLWVRRVKPPGFMFSINAYSRVVVIATGAGIAPVIPHVIANGHKLCIIWIGNDHKQAYGKTLWSLLDSHPHCNIFDTGVYGRPNVEELAIQAVRDFRAQAVFCVSNKVVTEKLVKACLKKGIPAYGATWDS